ncbi:MAG: HAMP domain-containing histidine kinase [Actinomycetota bacterium]|nr:HAMP domain-containing histidine kinase [Actinomycetota bacterium]
MAPATEDSAATAERNGRAAQSRSPDGGRSRRGDDARQPLLGDVRTRVLASFFILLVVSTAVSLLVLRQVLIARIGNDVRETLTAQVEPLRILATTGRDPETGEPIHGDLDRIFSAYIRQERAPDDGFFLTFVDGELNQAEPEGTQLPAELAKLASIQEPAAERLSIGGEELQYVAVPIRGGNEAGVLVAAESLEDEREQVESAVTLAIAVSVVVTLLASLFIWLAAGRAVQPLRALSRTTRTITETDLSDRVDVHGGDEIAELGRTFNGMLDRLESAFEDQKEFLADVGHELRTPITVIRGHLETLGDDPSEREEATTVIHGELERMSRLVDDLLLLARSDRADFLRPEPLDLDLFTHDLLAKARTLGSRQWQVDRADVALFVGDPHRLTSAVMNLAQNAVKHTRDDQVIAIGSSNEGGVIRIWVRDEGLGIEPHEQERIFERFARGLQQREHGHGAGLGLAIVKAITEAHGGWVELESRPGTGSTFSLVIPVEQHEDEEDEPWPEF